MDYGTYVGKNLLVKIDTGEDEGHNPTFREIAGKCIGGNRDGLAIRQRNGDTEIVEGLSILDIEETSSKLITRWVAHPTSTSVRQHLADRHAVPLDKIPPYGSDAIEMHDKIEHESLGHQHGEKAAKRAAAISRVTTEE